MANGLIGLTPKSGVDIEALTPEARKRLFLLDQVIQSEGLGKGIITSGKRPPTPGVSFSHHNTGNATDITLPGDMAAHARRLRELGFEAAFEHKGQVNPNGSVASGDHIHVTLHREGKAPSGASATSGAKAAPTPQSDAALFGISPRPVIVKLGRTPQSDAALFSVPAPPPPSKAFIAAVKGKPTPQSDAVLFSAPPPQRGAIIGQNRAPREAPPKPSLAGDIGTAIKQTGIDVMRGLALPDNALIGYLNSLADTRRESQATGQPIDLKTALPKAIAAGKQAVAAGLRGQDTKLNIAHTNIQENPTKWFLEQTGEELGVLLGNPLAGPIGHATAEATGAVKAGLKAASSGIAKKVGITGTELLEKSKLGRGLLHVGEAVDIGPYKALKRDIFKGNEIVAARAHRQVAEIASDVKTWTVDRHLADKAYETADKAYARAHGGNSQLQNVLKEYVNLHTGKDWTVPTQNAPAFLELQQKAATAGIPWQDVEQFGQRIVKHAKGIRDIDITGTYHANVARSQQMADRANALKKALPKVQADIQLAQQKESRAIGTSQQRIGAAKQDAKQAIATERQSGLNRIVQHNDSYKAARDDLKSTFSTKIASARKAKDTDLVAALAQKRDDALTRLSAQADARLTKLKTWNKSRMDRTITSASKSIDKAKASVIRDVTLASMVRGKLERRASKIASIAKRSERISESLAGRAQTERGNVLGNYSQNIFRETVQRAGPARIPSAGGVRAIRKAFLGRQIQELESAGHVSTAAPPAGREGGWINLGDLGQTGVSGEMLSKKWVRKPVWDTLGPKVAAVDQVITRLGRHVGTESMDPARAITGRLLDGYAKLIGVKKQGHVMGPGTFFGNLVYNTLGSTIGAEREGIPKVLIETELPKAMKDTAVFERTKRLTGDIDEMSDHTKAFLETYASIHGPSARAPAEIAGTTGKILRAGKMAVRVPGTRELLGKAWRAPTEAYSGLERPQKLALYRAAKKAGKTPKEAAHIVDKYLFDYSDKSVPLQVLDRYGVSIFNTWPVKVAHMVADTMVNRPDILARFDRLRRSYYQASPESKQRFENLPAHQRLYGTFPIPGAPSPGEQKFAPLSRALGITEPIGIARDIATGNFPAAGRELEQFIPHPDVGELLALPDLVTALLGTRTEPVPVSAKTAHPGAPKARQIEDILRSYAGGAAPQFARSINTLLEAQQGKAPGRYPFAEPRTPEQAAIKALFGLEAVRGETRMEALKRQIATKTATGNVYKDRVLAVGHAEKKSWKDYIKGGKPNPFTEQLSHETNPGELRAAKQRTSAYLAMLRRSPNPDLVRLDEGVALSVAITNRLLQIDPLYQE